MEDLLKIYFYDPVNKIEQYIKQLQEEIKHKDKLIENFKKSNKKLIEEKKNAEESYILQRDLIYYEFLKEYINKEKIKNDKTKYKDIIEQLNFLKDKESITRKQTEAVLDYIEYILKEY